MSVLQEAAGVIESRDDLVAFLEDGCKPRADWRIGTEHEKFGFRVKDNSPLDYDGANGIAAVLNELARRFDWTPVEEDGRVIGLTGDGRGNISLEPGGQLELSGAPLENVHQTCDEVNTHLDQVRAIGRDLGIGFLGLGFSPKWTLAETPRMPKGRYAIMSAYMPKVGRHGLDMMYRTCTVQVNLDFASEADMIRKLRVGLALQPVATAIFANSPFTEGRPNGFLSYRGEVWRDTDPRRTGMLPFAFEDGMGFERYVDYALDVPMYFVMREGRYVDLTGRSFRKFFEGGLDELPGERPTRSDWANHLTTIFPEVRLKNYLEMRGADGGPWKRLCALSAFWTGLLYDDTALDGAWDLVRDWTARERADLRDAVAKTALATPFRGGRVQDVARAALSLSRQGLKRRTLVNAMGDDESVFLDAVEQIVDSGVTPAERLLNKYKNAWNGDIERLFAEEAY